MDFNNNNGGDAQFNQAAFQQARMNELFGQIDLLSVDMFAKDFHTGKYCYEIIFNNLNSILITISPKLSSAELEELSKFRHIIRQMFELKPIYKKDDVLNFQGKPSKPKPIPENKNTIEDLLFNYRLYIEIAMDAHGLSNPNKETEGGWD